MSPPLSKVGRSDRPILVAGVAALLQPDCNVRPNAVASGCPFEGVSGMRARYPDTDGYVERDGVKVFYEVYGNGDPTILLMPTWPIVHSRLWKGQVAYLARHFRVVTYDPRGNGRSDRPENADAYTEDQYVADAVAVMDETGTSSAVVSGLCSSGRKA